MSQNKMKSVLGLKRTKRRKQHRLIKDASKKIDSRFKTYFIGPDEIESFDIKKASKNFLNMDLNYFKKKSLRVSRKNSNVTSPCGMKPSNHKLTEDNKSL